MKVLRLYLFILICLLLAIGFESTLAPTLDNSVIPYLDKLAHFCVFGFVAYLIATILIETKPQSSLLGVAVVSLLFVALLGAGNEWIQSFTPGRSMGIDDVFADVLGALVFLVVWNRLCLKCHATKKEG